MLNKVKSRIAGKKYLLTLAILFAATIAFAQPVKKPATQVKPPTQKEMEDMMKEAQKAMDEMSPEDKKMMDSMGIKMPSFKNVPKVSDKQLAEAWEDENRIVPKRSEARIASISQKVNDATMAGYLAAIQKKIAEQLTPDVKSTGDKVINYIKLNAKNSSEAGNMADAIWIASKPTLALYVMGKICADDPRNTDNLNNYAAMLSMHNAQQLAIPILNNLNKKFPGNSTLLNNLGQAWFGLGEITKAEKYLDSAIRIYAYHPQANYTKSFIEESKGNTAAATEAVKRSIKKSYSKEKENRLNKLGYKLKDDDLNWNFPMPQDPLGLEKFNWPGYPKNVAESEVLEKEWAAFKAACKNKLEELKIKEKKAEAVLIAFNEQFTKQLIQAGNKGIMVNPMPPFAPKAIVKLKYLVEGKDGSLEHNYKTKVEALASTYIQAASFEKTFSNELEVLEKKYEDQFGEGKPNPFDAACADDTKAKNAYLNSANMLLQEKSTDWINFLRRKINDEIYYYQYTMWPEQFEWAKIQAQINWLTSIQGQVVKFKDKSPWCQNIEDEDEDKIKPFKLQAFDDVACQYKSKMDLIIIKFTNNCSRMTSEFDFLFLNYVRKDDFERAEGDTYISSTFKISVEAGKDLKAGPLKVEAKVGGGIELEFGRQGLENVTLIGEAKVGIGTGIMDEDESGSPGIGIAGKDAFPTTVEAGVEGRISINCGKGSIKGSVKGSGVFENITVLKW